MKCMRYISKMLVAVIMLGTAIGCAKYRQHPLQPLGGISYERGGVSISAAALSDRDSYHYFSRHAVSKGFQPIQLSIYNNSDHAYVLNMSTSNVQVVDRYEVVRSFKLDALNRVIGWGIAGLFIWPFLIGAGVEAVKVSSANHRLEEDFDQRVLGSDSSVLIAPRSLISKVFFVRAGNIVPTLEFTLHDRLSGEPLAIDTEIAQVAVHNRLPYHANYETRRAKVRE